MGRNVMRDATKMKASPFRWLLIVNTLLSLLLTSRADETSSPPTTPEVSSDESKAKGCPAPEGRQCGLYLARSTIPHSGLGVFTGVSHNLGAVVAPPEIAHQLVLRAAGSRDGPSAPVAPASYGQSVVHDYTWSAFVSGGGFEADFVETLIPGLGMAANSFMPLVNARSIMGGIDAAGINRGRKSPGSGAFSPYHGITYVAERSLEAGSEIFADYGDAYFRGRPGVYGMVPLAPEFARADQMLKTLYKALPSTARAGAAVAPEWQAAWDAIRRDFVDDERVRNALPASVAEIPRSARKGTPHNFLRGENPRSLDWLETNGLCMDHLEIAVSALPDAGRGAFAKRSFVTGDTVHPLPLLQIPRRELNLYEGNSGETITSGCQLLLNYCIGHKDSSVLLMPYSSTANFINHGGNSANSKLVWANGDSDPMGYHDQTWMVKSAEKLLEQRRSGLLMLVVATKEIAMGEEVTIDYGSEWERQWLRHVQDWSPEDGDSTAAEYNESEDQIRTIFEEPYAPSVGTACHYRFGKTRDEQEAKNNPPFPAESNEAPLVGDDALHPNFDDRSLDRLRAKLSLIEQRSPSWNDLGGRTTVSGDHLRPCTIVARRSVSSDGGADTGSYTVRVYDRKDTPEYDKIPPNIEHYVKDVPRRAILFVDRARSSHQHHQKAFRQEIGFPDDAMWPKAWRTIQIDDDGDGEGDGNDGDGDGDFVDDADDDDDDY